MVKVSVAAICDGDPGTPPMPALGDHLAEATAGELVERPAQRAAIHAARRGELVARRFDHE